MKYLGIDYGSKRVGVAISDREGRMAFPKITLQNEANILKNIKDLCEREKVGVIVLGQSLNYKMQPNTIQKDIENWKLKIENLIGLPVYYQSEILTSTQAARNTDRDNLDASAAALILQSYLDTQNR